jgi:hypothetical protein
LSNIQINPYNFTAAAVGAWKEVARETLLSDSSTISVTSIPDKEYYMILSDTVQTGAGDTYIQYNGVTTSTYAGRRSYNYATDTLSPSVSEFEANNQTNGSNVLGVSYLDNIATKEKLQLGNFSSGSTAGSANAPNHSQYVMKHAQTTNPVSSYQHKGNSNFSTGSEVVILGWDTTDVYTPADNFWQELDDSSWSSGDTWTSGTFAAKKYLWVQFYSKSAGGSNYCRFNGDSGTNYANRYSINGGADSPIDTQPESYLGAIDGLSFNNLFIINNSANEKLLIANRVSRSTAGSSTSPTRMESVGKWANTSSQITSITITTAGGGSFTAGQMKVWGHD